MPLALVASAVTAENAAAPATIATPTACHTHLYHPLHLFALSHSCSPLPPTFICTCPPSFMFAAVAGADVVCPLLLHSPALICTCGYSCCCLPPFFALAHPHSHLQLHCHLCCHCSPVHTHLPSFVFVAVVVGATVHHLCLHLPALICICSCATAGAAIACLTLFAPSFVLCHSCQPACSCSHYSHTDQFWSFLYSPGPHSCLYQIHSWYTCDNHFTYL